MVYTEDKNLLKSLYQVALLKLIQKNVLFLLKVLMIYLLDKTAIQKTIEDLEKSDDLNSEDQLIIANAN